MGRLMHRLTARRPSRGDEGFSLVEVTISLVLLAVVLSSALSLFVRALNNADLQAQRQQAIMIANDRLESVRSLPPSGLLSGRGLDAVTAIWNWDANLSSVLSLQVYDLAAAATSTGVVPTYQALEGARYDNVSYKVRTYIDLCYLPSATNVCGKTVTGRQMYRITVNVAWSPRGTRECDQSEAKILSGARASDRCQEYTVSTLRDINDDATFNTN